jgi:hypothetical protein
MSIASFDNCPIPANFADYISTTDITPVTEPVTLEMAKKWLRMENIDDDNDLIEELIIEARMWVERFCALSMVPKNIKCTINLHHGSVELPYGPVDTDTVEVRDTFGNIITTGFTLTGETGTFAGISGYGIFSLSYTSMQALQSPLLGAIRSYIAYAYEHRGDMLSDENDLEFAKEAKQKAKPFMRQIFI